MWQKILINVLTLGIPAIIDAIARARRDKREQEARLKKQNAKKAKATEKAVA